MYKALRPILFMLPAEAAHNIAIKALKTGLLPANKTLQDERLKTKLWHLNFPNPVGLAAGFDKNAEVIAPMLKAGFGFVECGTVTPKPQDGNQKPRVFRCPDEHAVINRMGFPGSGAIRFKENLTKYLDQKPRLDGILGLNIGINKTQTEPLEDYRKLIQSIGAMGDYITVNISSPNTPGLRNLQERENFLPLIEDILEARNKYCGSTGVKPPLLVKLAPDLTAEQQEEVAKAALDSGIDGLILTNTTLDRPSYLPESFAGEKGGLSGRPLKDKSTKIICNFYRLTNGKIPIIGIGGIENAEDAYTKIKAGASLVQIYSALIYHGPQLVSEINQGLIALLERDGYHHISEAIGADHKGDTQNAKLA